MPTYLRLRPALRTDRRGVTAIEYALIAALIVTALVTGMTTFTSGLTSAFTGLGTQLTSAGSK